MLEHLLQTVAAGLWVTFLMFGEALGLGFSLYLLVYSRFWLLIVAYFAWIFWDLGTGESGGRRLDYLRHSRFWRYLSGYFPVRLVKTADLPPSSNYLFIVYPHGVFCYGGFINFCSDATDFSAKFPGIRSSMLTMSFHLWFPFAREIYLAIGGISCSERSISREFKQNPQGGRALSLVVGGTKEIKSTRPGAYEIILNDRKGFVKVAIKNGTPLVPVFIFGEPDTHNPWTPPKGTWLYTLQGYTERLFGLPLFFPWGRFGILPTSTPLTTVIGAPIPVPKIAEPTRDLVNEYHAQFTRALQELFEEHKMHYVARPEKARLVIS